MGKDTKKDQLLGMLDLMILRVLNSEPRHGYGIARRIENISDDVLSVQQGSLYPALHRLEKRAFIQSEWQMGASNKPVKIYSLTPAGKRQLDEEANHWELVSAAVNRVLKNA
ncbi:MAG: PadR family transcriptional regulator PadR [Candidatus Binatia bacterium]|jgi:PadR family transcriptional regulator PadR